MKPLTFKRVVLILSPFFFLLLLSAFFCPFLGFGNIDVQKVLSFCLTSRKGPVPNEVFVLLSLRVPRVLLAILAGGALALSGASFQALLRNPLATPYTLGVASGGALGASTAIYLDRKLGLVSSLSFGPVSGTQIFCLAGALCTVAMVYLLARKRRSFSIISLILAGVTIGLIANAMIIFVRYISDPYHAVLLDRWLMGSLEVMGYAELGTLFPFLLPGLFLLFAQAGPLNQLAFGEEMAAGRGVNVNSVQRITFFAGSLTVASVVAVTGPIGFVGLMVPHALRRIIGSDHRLLMPASFMAGGAFLAICDMGSRLLLRSNTFPVGIVTALLGGPFFLYLLLTRD